MATHSRILAYRIPGTEEPGGLPSMGLHRVGHDRSDLAAATAAAGYFHVLAIVNSAAINTGAHVSFWNLLYDGGNPKVVLHDNLEG